MNEVGKSSGANYRAIIQDDQSLAIFLRAMQKFDHLFCDLMTAGTDFTLRLEVHGNQGEILHCRTYQEEIARPTGVERRIERKRSGV